MNMYRPTEGVNDFSGKFIISYDTFVDALKYIAQKYHITGKGEGTWKDRICGEQPFYCKGRVYECWQVL